MSEIEKKLIYFLGIKLEAEKNKKKQSTNTKVMGRCYYGSIEGKFWFGCQSSCVLQFRYNFDELPADRVWRVCGCYINQCEMPVDEEVEYCEECYDSREQHIEDIMDCDIEEGEEFDGVMTLEEEQSLNVCLENNEENQEMVREKIQELEEQIRESFNITDIGDAIGFEIGSNPHFEWGYECDSGKLQELCPSGDNDKMELIADWCIGKQLINWMEADENEGEEVNVSCEC